MATSTDLRAAIEEVQNQLPEDQLAGDLEGAYEADWATKIERRVGAMPWWVISAVVHSVIFLLATLLTVALPQPQIDEVTITADLAKKEQPEYDPKKKRDIFKNPQEVKAETQVENPVVVHEQAEVSETFETDNDMDTRTARGQEDAISDIPLGGTGVTGSVGVGGGGMAGCFGYRDGGGRKKAVARFGGSPATESAVEAALRWLARHQEPDGHWNGKKYEAKGNDGDVGITGLALLAFLGAGHTEKSGRFRDNVRRAQAWLISQQSPKDGLIGYKYREFHHGYGGGYLHPIAALALAESYGMAKNPQVGAAAQKAVDFAINVHQKPYEGWRYENKSAGDVSATGWYVMFLKSSRIAGLKVDGAGFQGAMNLINRCTNKKNGSVGYMNARGVPSTTAVGMVCRQFMGQRNTNKWLVKGAEYLMSDPENLPAWDKKNGRCVWGPCTFYHWYYGTLAMFQMGGKDWMTWNAALKKTLLPKQCKGGPMDGSANDKDGSWDPLGRQTRYGGRVYSTAVGALCLEVYYRYLPMFTK